MTRRASIPFDDLEALPQVKLCKDCKHAFAAIGNRHDVCDALTDPPKEPPTKVTYSIDLVTGDVRPDFSGAYFVEAKKVLAKVYSMHDMRQPGAACGPDGKLFEPSEVPQ